MNIKSRISNFSIRNKLLATMLISVIIPFFVFGAVLFSAGKEELNQRVTTTYLQTLNQLSLTFNEYISRTDQTNRIVDNNSDIPNWLRNEVTQLITDPVELFELEQAALCSLEEFSKTNEDLYSISAVTFDGKSLIYADRKFDRSLADYDSEYYLPLINSTGNTVVLPVKMSQSAFSPPTPVFSVGFKHLDIQNEDESGINGYTGYIISECPVSVLEGFCNSIDLGEGSSLYIIDGNGALAYTDENDSEIIDRTLSLLKSESKGTNITTLSGTYYLIGNSISGIDWTVYALIPLSFINQNTARLQFIFILMSFFSLALIIFLAWIQSRYFTKPIFVLLDSMKRVADGDLTVRFSDTRRDEFGKLGDGFNSLVEKTEKLISDVAESESREASAKYSMLQSQINPHFLYNTLDTIRMMAILNDQDKIADALLHLSKLFRYNIKNSNRLVTIREEVEQIKNYLSLQELRMEDRIKINYMIDPDVLYMRMPKMLLQPIVENIFSHAFMDLEKDGMITVEIRSDEKNIYFRISDNGNGISETELMQLKKRLKSSNNPPGESIGLVNVNERLRLYYSDKHTLSIESAEGKGTSVSFTLPIGEDKTDLYNYESHINRNE